MTDASIVGLSIVPAAVSVPLIVGLVLVSAAVCTLIVGAALAARARTAPAAEEPDRRVWDDADLYDIE
jgi:hypothetical protein